MSPSEIERSIRTVAASLEMEGLSIDPQYVAWCRRMLAEELSMEEYLALVIERAKA